VDKYASGLPLGLGDKFKDVDVKSLFEGVKPYFEDQEKLQREMSAKMLEAAKYVDDNKHHIETVKNVGANILSFF
jgi:hypothetical protein